MGSLIILADRLVMRVMYRELSEGRLRPMIFDAFLTMRSSFLDELASMLPYHTLNDDVRMLWIMAE